MLICRKNISIFLADDVIPWVYNYKRVSKRWVVNTIRLGFAFIYKKQGSELSHYRYTSTPQALKLDACFMYDEGIVNLRKTFCVLREYWCAALIKSLVSQNYNSKLN